MPITLIKDLGVASAHNILLLDLSIKRVLKMINKMGLIVTYIRNCLRHQAEQLHEQIFGEVLESI